MSSNSSEPTTEFASRPKFYVVLAGNDGSGKSTLVTAINKLFREGKIGFVACERSNTLGADKPAHALDKLTLIPAFEQKADYELPSEHCGVPVRYVVIDVPVSVSIERLSKRPSRNEWESPRALHYFAFRFMQLSAFFGLPRVSNMSRDEDVAKSVSMAIEAISYAIEHYDTCQKLALRSLTYDQVVALDVETQVASMLDAEDLKLPSDFPTHWFELKDFAETEMRRLVARYYVQTHDISFDEDDGSIYVGRFKMPGRLHFQLEVEGESKRVYRIVTPVQGFNELCLIKLKSTIYSHKRQSTGEIAELAGVRGVGSQIVLEILARNGIDHAYLDVSSSGLIMAAFIEPIPPTEIVVKRFCLGSDRHVLHGLANNRKLVDQMTGEYKAGPYVRFDWRNPNHVDRASKADPSQSCRYYYLVEEFYGKEPFFRRYLEGKDSKFEPIGDTATTAELVDPVLNTTNARETAMKVFLSLQHYLAKCTPALTIQDLCLMTDSSGFVLWSEINPDCMRIKAEDGAAYDKDIWRAGGSSSRDEILAKWRKFNQVLAAVLAANPFSDCEMADPEGRAYHQGAEECLDRLRRYPGAINAPLFQALSAEQPAAAIGRRRVILTIDLHEGKPSLVRQGKVSATHSNGDPFEALKKIGLFPDILVVNLDGAFGQVDSPNGELIRRIARQRYIYAGGGFRTLEDVQHALSSSVRRVVIGTAAVNGDLIEKIPRDRLIVELSVDEKLNVMTHGRATTTAIGIFSEIKRVAALGVDTISITFHANEGMLGGIARDKIKAIVVATPQTIGKIIIAGGITSIQDCEFLWSLDSRIVPQLGSAIWTDTISLPELMTKMVSYDHDGLAPATVQDKNGVVRGIVYMNKEALRRTVSSQQLWRFSRTSGQLMHKGATESGNYQSVLQIANNCNGDSLLITVDGDVPFCHRGDKSCFPMQTVVKAGIGALADNLHSHRLDNSYSAHMQNNPGLAFAKMREELHEIACAQTPDDLTGEMADLLIHLLMFASGRGVVLDDVLNELNARRFDPHLTKLVVSTSSQRTAPADTVVLGIMADKYTAPVDSYLLSHVGIQVHRNASDKRDMRVRGTIVDKAKFAKIFGETKLAVALVPMKPKDMAFELSRGRADAIVSDSVTMLNHPQVSQEPVAEWHDESLKLCLIYRELDAPLTKQEWSSSNKCLVAAEHPMLVAQHLHKFGFKADTFTLDALSGGAEGYLLNEGTRHYSMCDAIVQSGDTLRSNGLAIATVITDQIKIGVYRRIEKQH